MKSVLLRPSLLAIALAAIAASALAKDCTADPSTPANSHASAVTSYPSMGNIVFINPLADMMRMQAAMDREFNSLNAMGVPVMLAPPLNFTMPVETSALHRTANGYQLHVSVSGFKPDDIHVQLNGRLLNISAQDSTQGSYKVGNVPQQAMSTRSFSETLTLPESVEASGMKQSVQNGVLTITLPSNQKAGAGKA
jgi:HSP20 family molecular chaperone IbpA